MYFLRIPQRVCMSLSLFVCVCVGVRVYVCDTCRHAAAEDKAQLLLPASAAAFAVAVGIAASSCLGCGGRKWRQCQRRRQNFWQTLVFMCVCVCVIPCARVCVCVGVVVCGGKGGWHVRVWLAAARLCLWSLSVSAVASRARLQSFIIKIFCTRIFINCFVSHPPQHTHSHTFRTHTHAWGGRHFYEANLMLSFFISHFCCAIFGFYSLFGAPQKRRGKWKWNCNMRPASNYCRHHKATPNGHLSKL